LGGEEFGIFLPNTTAVEAQPVIERIRLALAESIVRYGNDELRVTTSFGPVTSLADAQHHDLDSLFKAADAAMYTAKGLGRNRVVCQ
jgi:diguanylate cyclase (GGDEF)-like protein